MFARPRGSDETLFEFPIVSRENVSPVTHVRSDRDENRENRNRGNVHPMSTRKMQESNEKIERFFERAKLDNRTL